MKQFINKLLSNGGFIILNKPLVKELGLDLGVVLSYMIKQWGNFEYKEFFYTLEKIEDETGLSRSTIRRNIKALIDKGFVINKGFKGKPPKQYYALNLDLIKNLIETQVGKNNEANNNAENDAENEQFLEGFLEGDFEENFEENQPENISNSVKIKPCQSVTVSNLNRFKIKPFQNDTVCDTVEYNNNNNIYNIYNNNNNLNNKIINNNKINNKLINNNNSDLNDLYINKYNADFFSKFSSKIEKNASSAKKLTKKTRITDAFIAFLEERISEGEKDATIPEERSRELRDELSRLAPLDTKMEYNELAEFFKDLEDFDLIIEKLIKHKKDLTPLIVPLETLDQLKEKKVTPYLLVSFALNRVMQNSALTPIGFKRICNTALKFVNPVVAFEKAIVNNWKSIYESKVSIVNPEDFKPDATKSLIEHILRKNEESKNDNNEDFKAGSENENFDEQFDW